MPPTRRSTRAARDSGHASAPTNRNPRSGGGKTSLRLTVKVPPSKLRQATSGSQLRTHLPPNPYADVDEASESDATPAPRTARSTRNPRTVVEPESDEEEEEEDGKEVEVEDAEEDDEEEEDEDEEMEDVDNDLLQNEDSEEDAEGEAEEEDEDDEDELQSDHPPPPTINIKHARSSGKGVSKPNVTVTAPPEGPLQSVEDKEMDLDSASDEDDELSELSSRGGAEGRRGGEDEEGDEDDSSSASSSSGREGEGISRSATPDLSKLTRRQRGFYEEADTGLMALSNEAQKKKHLTAEEHAMRRAEMARRRKNLSEKRNEEEKMDTIHKLLKKPSTKRRTRAEMAYDAAMGTPGEFGEDGEEYAAPDPLFVRWVSNARGSRLGVPSEWMESSAGDVFQGASAGRSSGGGGGSGSGRMVDEVY